ncbi:TonB-linked outer membrane protein, SusC/RagA family [Pedobacter sp. ok626]|uniref:SusC/RagA family TonB-linked outer membrane protein n=1 Tax=Pedobacter sp. ok626 TaxID=1761882 RepID=UPI000892790A|nr:SusC/RagA family TonB-linked outer membrane protein [Pedobacter sp. ok626]SDL65985.1 TonB-linked outer membrane protein, SusC/RagA family [Pedobacter sp. ok626]
MNFNETMAMPKAWLSPQKLLIMKLTTMLLFLSMMQVYGSAYSQKITLDNRNTSIKVLLKNIEKQSGYLMFYNENEININRKIDVSIKNATLEEALKACFENVGVVYKIFGKDVIIRNEPKTTIYKESRFDPFYVKGKVLDAKGKPIPGVTVKLKGTNLVTATDNNGNYSMRVPDAYVTTLVFSFLSMETLEVDIKGRLIIDVVLKEKSSALDEVTINTGFQKIDTKVLTGAVTSLKMDDIKVPGINTIGGLLEGRVPGMVFMQNTGQVGVAPRLRIRGTSTILGTQEPLWVIDGIVQQDPVNVDPTRINDLDFVNLLSNAVSGLNPDDIDQIDVLKDASATAIYGARAANGVIVITTKKGKTGPATINYSVSTTYSPNPSYSDKSVNMMNSKDRIAFSRDLIEKRIDYPAINSWVGYEGALKDFYSGQISYDEMVQKVGYYERLNTDWFDILTRNAISNKHTLTASGGSNGFNYYSSLGFNNETGSIRGENNRQYTANIKVNGIQKRLTYQVGLQANKIDKNYTPSDINIMGYAYNTSRAVPAYNENGSLWYYDRKSNPNSLDYVPFNIISDRDNSYERLNSSGINLNTQLGYRVSNPLKVGLIFGYTIDNTAHDTYHGYNTFYAGSLRNIASPGLNYMPVGGELKQDDNRHESYVLRGQLDYDSFLDRNQKHKIIGVMGGEISSNKYSGLAQTHRGFDPDRGLVTNPVDPVLYTGYAKWTQSEEALGRRTAQLTNMASAFATATYIYNNLYIFNVNSRIDASNKFGSRSNDKLLPIWSVSGRWNIADDILKSTKWVDQLSLRASYGWQGNMLDNESTQLLIKKGAMDVNFGEYASTIYKYANPNLNWEKTSSTNVMLDFSLFNRKINGSFTYFYKKTRDAFLSKTVSAINGVTGYVVNSGTIVNKGIEATLNFVPVNNISTSNPNGFRWTFDPQIGQIINTLVNNAISNKENVLRDVTTYRDYLNGNIEIAGQPLNSFYSYKYTGLSAVDGRPVFYGTDQAEFSALYKTKTNEQVMMSVMEYSGSRVPTIQGGFSNSFSYKRLSLGFNATYSLGSKIRLLQLYPNLSSGTIAPQPTENVRNEMSSRWQRPGDEIYTNIPGVIDNTTFRQTLSPWWGSTTYAFSSNIWEMYNYSNIRVVSGNYLKLQSVNLRYNLPENFCKRLFVRSIYAGLSGTNLFTLASKDLNGQDPTTQAGSSSTINMSLRPTYSFNLNISL